MPSTLPASSWRGDTVVSSSSMTREAFSSVTLTATALPKPTNAANSASMPIETSAWSSSLGSGSSTATGSGGGAVAASASSWVRPRPRKRLNVRCPATACWTTPTAGFRPRRADDQSRSVDECDVEVAGVDGAPGRRHVGQAVQAHVAPLGPRLEP